MLVAVFGLLMFTSTVHASAVDDRWTDGNDGHYYFDWEIGDYKIEFEELSNYMFEYTTKNQQGTLNGPYQVLTITASDAVILRVNVGNNYATYQLIKNGTVLESVTSGMQGGSTLSVRYKELAPIDVGNISAIEDLPKTAGNPFDGVDQQYGSVRYKYDDLAHKLSVEVSYNGVYVFEYVTTNIEFLEGMKQAFYYTKGLEKFIVIFYEDSMPLVTGEITSWGGFAVWNLNTNDIVITNKLRTLTLIELVGMDAYAYFYMPDIQVDDLLSVDLTYDYEIETNSFLFWGSKWQPKQTQILRLTKDGMAEGSIPQYMYEVYTGSKAALAVGAVLTAIPGTQAVGIPLLFLGAGATAGLTLGLNTENHSYIENTISQIKKIQADEALATRLELHYSNQAGQAVSVNPTNGLYQLYLGNFAGEGHEDVRITNYQYTDITFMSFDKVYTIEGDDLIQLWSYTKPDLAPGIDPNPTHPNNPDNQVDLGTWFNDNQVIIYYAVAVLLFLLSLALIARLFNSTRRKKYRRKRGYKRR